MKQRQLTYDIIDILAYTTVTIYTSLKELLGKLPCNLYKKLQDKLIDNAEPGVSLEPDEDPNPSSDSKELDSLFERLRKAYELLLKLLGDSSKTARAKLQELYEYVSGLFEELRKMGSDWMSDPRKALVLLLIAIIVIAIVAVLPQAVNTEQKREELEDLQVARFKKAQTLKNAARAEQAKELVRLQWKLDLIDEMDQARLRPWVKTPWESMVRQQVEIEVEKLKYQLKF